MLERGTGTACACGLFGENGACHWEVLLRARAIENNCYVVASAQEGRHESGRVCYGHSCIVDPWGTVISQAGEGSEVIYADIDNESIQKSRNKIPTLEHVRLISK